MRAKEKEKKNKRKLHIKGDRKTRNRVTILLPMRLPEPSAQENINNARIPTLEFPF